MSHRSPEAIARALVAHFRSIQRDLPWRRTRDPYAIWVSEIMLQQTRVATVIPYYERFLQRFPDVHALAAAPLDDVLALWSGLGYYSRARNLHRGAQHVVEQCGGEVPRSHRGLLELPGVGRYTAGAIASIAYGLREPVVDGNVARVLARLYELEGDIKSSASTRRLWSLAGELVPADAPGDFNQGLMELGATVCTPLSPTCLICPLRAACQARAAGRERELPHMPRRKSREQLPLIDTSALWIVRRKRLLLARRVAHGLYGGLWELPQTEDRAQLSHLLEGATLDAVSPVYEHRQTLTHRRLHIRVYPAKLAAKHASNRLPVLGKPCNERYDKLEWQSLTSLQVASPTDSASQNTTSKGISAATRAIIDAFLETETWNSTKKRSTSSTRATRKSSKGSRS